MKKLLNLSPISSLRQTSPSSPGEGGWRGREKRAGVMRVRVCVNVRVQCSRIPAMPPIPSPPAAESRAFLASTRLFGGLDAAALDEIAGELEWWLVPGGTRVCQQGDEGDCLYLVASGRLVVVRELGRGQETIVGQKGRGDSLGELSVLTGSPRSATVRALRDTVLVRLSRERAEGVLRKHPEVLLALTRMLAAWLHAEPHPPTR